MSGKRKCLFDSDGEEEVDDSSFKINKQFAKRFNDISSKKELAHLQAKYGDDDETSESSEDETGEKLPPSFDASFMNVIASIKKKDPKIYDSNHTFFAPETSDFLPKPATDQKKKPENKGVFLPDLEMDLLLKYEGKIPEEEEGKDLKKKFYQNVQQPTYAEEQEQLKESLKAAVNDSNTDEEDDLLTKRKVSKKELVKRDKEYTTWKKQEIDRKVKKNMKLLLKASKKSEKDKLLYDYILNKKYVEQEEDDEEEGEKRIPTYDEIVASSDDEGDRTGPICLVEQEEKESKDDQEPFTKRLAKVELPDTAQHLKPHPRKLKGSVRKKDDARRTKRLERKARKEKEKTLRMEELKRMKVLKRKEIMDKLERIKKITGNARMGFDNLDIEGDFDPDQHDKQMQGLFSQDYYGDDEVDDQKPQFTDDEDDGVENWDEWQGEQGADTEGDHLEEQGGIGYHEPHCEDPDFNMDCDYDPSAKDKVKDSGIQIGRKRKLRKSAFAKAVEKRKPTFDPTDKQFEEYFDEYYKLDYEDMVGDLPCRFKYRNVVANDFGLSMEEILAADTKELNMWCPVTKMSQYRRNEEERNDIAKYHQDTGKLVRNKVKIFTSLFGSEEDGEDKTPKGKKSKKAAAAAAAQGKPDELVDDSTAEASTSKVLDSSEEQPRKKKKRSHAVDGEETVSETAVVAVDTPKKSKKKKRWSKQKDDFGFTDARLHAYGIAPKKFRNKKKYGEQKAS